MSDDGLILVCALLLLAGALVLLVLAICGDEDDGQVNEFDSQ